LAKFLDKLLLECLPDGKNWIVQHEYRFVADSGEVFYIPAGGMIDFASTPRIIWSLYPPATGLYRRGAAMHDWIYKTRQIAITRFRGDMLFKEGMDADRTNIATQRVIYRAVRMFGGSSYIPREIRLPV